MADLLEDIITYLTTGKIVQGAAIDCFKDTVPNSPDSCVFIYEYGGRPSGLGNFGRRSVQFNARAKTYVEAKTTINSVYKYLGGDGVEGQINFTDIRWGLIQFKQTPFKSQVDSKGRTVFTFNTEIITNSD